MKNWETVQQKIKEFVSAYEAGTVEKKEGAFMPDLTIKGLRGAANAQNEEEFRLYYDNLGITGKSILLAFYGFDVEGNVD